MPSGIKALPLAALASLFGVLIFVGLSLIGIDLNMRDDIHVMLAPVSNNHFHISAMLMPELSLIIGLMSCFSIMSLISSISRPASLTHVCLKSSMMEGSARGSGGSGSGGIRFIDFDWLMTSRPLLGAIAAPNFSFLRSDILSHHSVLETLCLVD